MWENPKINWTTNDVIGTADLNRIEKNINHRRGYIDGFILTHLPGSYFVGISGGMINIGDKTYHTNTPTTKSIGAPWEAGPAVAGRTEGVALTANKWYHVFLLGSPLEGIVDIAFDNSPLGTNIAVDAAIIAAGYTDYRRIGSILWRDVSNFFLRWKQTGDLFDLSGYCYYPDITAPGYVPLSYWINYPTEPGILVSRLPAGVQVIAKCKMRLTVTDPNTYTMISAGDPEKEAVFLAQEGQSTISNIPYVYFEEVTEESSIYVVPGTIGSYTRAQWALGTNSYIDIRGKDNQVCEELIPVTTTPGA